MNASTEKKKRSLVLPVALGIVALAFGGFFASRMGLDKALVKQQVDAFIASAESKAKESGRDLKITYKDLEVVGSFTKKHVVLQAPELVVQPSGAAAMADGAKQDAVKIATEKLEIFPQSADLSSLRIEAPAPFTVTDMAAPEKLLLTVTSNAAPALTVARSKQGEIEYSSLDYRAPGQMEFKYLKEADAEIAMEEAVEAAEGTSEEAAKAEAAPAPTYETLTVAMAAGSGFKANMAQDKSGLGTASLDITDLVMTPSQSPESAVKAPKIKGEWSNALNEKKLNVVKALLEAGPITSADAALPYQPVTVAIDGAFEGPITNTPEAVANAPAQSAVMTLKTFKIETKDSTLNASANFTASASDMMPVGSATLSLSNVPYVLAELRKVGMVNDSNGPMIEAMLQKITGSPIAELTDVNIAIDRPKDGAFKVGSTTFEELFAVMLSHAMSGQQAPAAGTPDAAPAPSHTPQLPPADAPRAAPIEVPNHGDRG